MSHVSRGEARRAVLLPDTQSTADLQQVFERGYVAWQDPDGDIEDVDDDALISAVERFTHHAITPDTDIDRVANPDADPIVEQPAVLAVVSTLGAVAVCEHPALSDTARHNIALLEEIRDLYVQTAQSFVYAGETTAMLQWLAEHLYQKPAGEDGPHPGRVCTGVERLDDGHHYVAIPLPAASQECIARAGEDGLSGGYDQKRKCATGTVVSRLQGNTVYVPVGHLLKQHQEHLAEAFDRVLSAHEQMLTDEQRQWLVNEADAISDRIDRFLEAGHQEYVWSNWDTDSRTVRVLRAAVLDSGLDIDEAHPPGEIYRALEHYEPTTRWERTVRTRFGNPTQLDRELADLADADVAVGVEEQPSGTPDRYRIGHGGGGAESLAVTDIEDLFELPCFAAMDDRLQEQGPVRKDLYNFVRLVMWLPDYRHLSIEELLADLHDVFERWPWYDHAETEYQVRYEFTNDIAGEEPLPMGCTNPDMERYCIGREACPYSIYGSLPFPEELYEQLDDAS